MSRGVYHGIHSSLLDDPDFQQLSAHARLVLLTLRLCKDAGPAVIFRYYPEVIAKQAGLTLRQIEAALLELETPPLRQPPWVRRHGPVVWVRNGLRHDPMVRLSSQKHRAAVIRQLESLPRNPVTAQFCQYYGIVEKVDSLSSVETDYRTDTDTDTDTEQRTPTAAPLNGNGHHPRVAPVITAALDRSARLRAAPRLRSPEFWTAEAGAAGGTLDLAAEILKADAWLIANPRRAPRKNLARFVHNWLARAKEYQA